MDFFDDDFGMNSQTDGVQDDFSDDFFDDDDFGTESSVVLPAARPKFNRIDVKPEPINLSVSNLRELLPGWVTLRRRNVRQT